MLLILGILLPCIAGLASAFPPPTAPPSAIETGLNRRQAAKLSDPPSPKSSASPKGTIVEFSVEYINSNGATTGEVVTISEPADVLGSGTYVSDLPLQTDPCGPKVQGPDTFPTCDQGATNLTSELGLDPSYVYQSDEPAYYGAVCMNSTEDKSALNTKSCNVSIVDVCRKINSRYSPKGKWVWSSIGGPGCAVGYWVPAYNGSAPVPDLTRCEQGIYGSMMSLCVTQPDIEDFYGVSNLVAVNIVDLPSANGTGSQVNVGYPSYIIAPQKLPMEAGPGRSS